MRWVAAGKTDAEIGIILGIAESVVLTTAGTAWAPAVAFGILLLVLGVRPAGLFGR